MAGILKIHSTTAGPLNVGHSWIEYAPIDGQPTTFGTWGNTPTGLGNGLLQDVEILSTRQPGATRVRIIDDEQERRLFELVCSYRARGPEAWSLLSPCSAFAAEAWEYTTGERLAHRTALVSTPARLLSSIVEANQLEQKLRTETVTRQGLAPRPASGSSSSAGDNRTQKRKNRPRRL